MSLSDTTPFDSALVALETERTRSEKLRQACQNAKIRCRRALENPDLTLATPQIASNKVADILSELDQVWDTSPSYQGGPLTEEITH